MAKLIHHEDCLFKHPELRDCSCGAKASISTGAYANEPVMIVCLFCDKTSQSFTMGIYEDGITKAINDWNKL